MICMKTSEKHHPWNAHVLLFKKLDLKNLKAMILVQRLLFVPCFPKVGGSRNNLQVINIWRGTKTWESPWGGVKSTNNTNFQNGSTNVCQGGNLAKAHNFATFHNARGYSCVWSKNERVFATSMLRGDGEA